MNPLWFAFWGFRKGGFFVIFVFLFSLKSKNRFLVDGGSTARVYGLDLGEVDGAPAEAGGELAAVEEGAAGRVDGAQVAAGRAADADLADRLLEGAELLRVVAVRREGGVLGPRGRVAVAEALRERPRGRGGVRLGSVVDAGCRTVIC